MPRWRIVVAVALALVVAVPVGLEVRRLILGAEQASTEAPFYELPSDIPAGAPGAVFRSEPILGAPVGAQAWRVLYHSTDEFGADVVVSGVVVAPTGAAPDRGRPIASWAHPTTGASPRCAPSLSADPFILMAGLHLLLAEGYVVVATDYPGLGLDTPSSYLIGATEGHAVLDIARVAQAIPEAEAGERLLLWGHSQGGHAALFAAQLSANYAPEFEVAGVAVAAPAADLGALLNDDIDDVSGVTIASYAFQAYADFYGPTVPGAELDTLVTPAAAIAIPKMTELCNLGQVAELHEIAAPLVGGFLSSDPTTTAPWDDLLQRNTPDASGDIPLFIAQGTADTLVDPPETVRFARAACESGRSVTFVELTGVSHGLAGEAALPDLLLWLDSLSDGPPASTGCPVEDGGGGE